VLNQQPKKEREHAAPVKETVKKIPVEKKSAPAISVPVIKPLQIEASITAVVVNFETKELIQKAVTSFREYYPTLPLVIVDNHSTDGSREWIRKQKNEYTRAVLNRSNKGHGPALHKEFQRAHTDYIFTFDSDVEFLRGGLLESMVNLIQDAYAIGWRRWVNEEGVSVDEKQPFDASKYCPYIHPYAALYHRETYLTLSPFINNGAPAIFNMRDAHKQDIRVVPFYLEPYVRHLVAGTRRMWKGHWFPGNKPKLEGWNEERHYPI
jgi:glycosyltransferase involved in cell wall biosynthesis